MGIIINPRGIGGSGKTELARRIMREYGWAAGGRHNWPGKGEPLFKPGREYPIGYRLFHPLDCRPLLVFGHYERTCGGCDTISLRDGGLREVFRLAADHASRGHDVLLEGLHLSSDTEISARLARLFPTHVLHLSTPPAASVRNLLRRRRAGSDKKTHILNGAIAEHEQVARACERLRPHARVHHLGFDDALAKARELLHLA